MSQPEPGEIGVGDRRLDGILGRGLLLNVAAVDARDAGRADLLGDERIVGVSENIVAVSGVVAAHRAQRSLDAELLVAFGTRRLDVIVEDARDQRERNVFLRNIAARGQRPGQAGVLQRDVQSMIDVVVPPVFLSLGPGAKNAE